MKYGRSSSTLPSRLGRQPFEPTLDVSYDVISRAKTRAIIHLKARESLLKLYCALHKFLVLHGLARGNLGTHPPQTHILFLILGELEVK